jgi:hypothetical protein
MHASGEFQGALFMEAAIELVATSAGLEPMLVQWNNMDPVVAPVRCTFFD